MLPLFIPFFWKFTFIYLFFFWKKTLLFHLFITFLQNCFWSISFVVSPLFLFFPIVWFRTRWIDPFFFWQSFDFFLKKKSFIVFRFFFEVPFFKKTLFFEFLRKLHTKKGFNNKMIVQISLSGNLFVLKKNPSLQPFKKNVFCHLLLVSFIVRKKFSWKNLIRKIVFLKKTRLFLSPLDFCFSFILSKNSFAIFQLSF